MNSRRHQQGFTLMELMVAIAILAILISIAAPSFTHLIARKQVDSFTTQVVGAMQLARSEAITRNTNVSICPRSGATSCGGSWLNGLLVFVDDNGNGSLDGGTDTLLQDAEMDYGRLTLGGSYGGSVTYQPSGTVTNNGNISACNDYSHGTNINVNAVGRPRLENYSASCP